ncbi:MAG: hypothetical protein JSR45_11855 [Proteobacteria bacterium]|nr:hypothetical protein [Pseudomonadota bacterium]
MRAIAFLAAAFALSSAGAAFAEPSATLSGGYSDIQPTGGGGHVDNWNLAAAAAAPVGDSGWAVQGDVARNSLHGAGVSGETANYSLSAYRTGANGRIGLSAGYNTFQGLGISSRSNYGGFGEYWPSERLTLGAKAAGVSGGGSSGGYGGAEVVVYPAPDVALSGTVDYLKQSGVHVTVGTLTGEWLPSRRSPASVYAGYSNVDLAGFRQNVWLVGVKLQFGQGARASLVERQRSGPAGWAAAATALKF